jgi:hypothetical protein
VLTISEVNEVAHRAASIALGRVGVSRVYSEPTTDSDGDEVLSVTVVLKGAGDPEATGAEALHAIAGIGRALDDAGEARRPIVWFATEEELAAELNGDIES